MTTPDKTLPAVGDTASREKYWTLVEQEDYRCTYEHRTPHGTLILVRITGDSRAVALCWVPAAPHPGQERP